MSDDLSQRPDSSAAPHSAAEPGEPPTRDELAPPPLAPPAFQPPPLAPPPFEPPVVAAPPFAAPPFAAPPFPPPPFAPVPNAPHLFTDQFRVPRGRPVLGGSLWVFGAVLWAYVVMGEWVLRFDLPEAWGALVVLASYGLAWFSCVEHLRAPADRWRKLTPGALGLVLFVILILLVTSLFGTTRQSVVGGVTLLLWFFAAAFYMLGRRLTGRPRVIQPRRRTAATVALWLVSGLGTIASLGSIMSHT